MTTFKDLSLPQPLYGALEKMNFITPTPVQAASLPPALQGKDVLGSAQTGTGKTGAFGIPLLAKLYPNPGSRALILAPTRELAAQIHKVLGKMSDGMHLKGALLVGGESFFNQKREVKAGADYYVCTPGRLIDHLDAGLKLTNVSVLVLDEVDRMLDMGFAPQLKQIVPHIPKERQTLFFSATLPKEILSVAATYLKDPVRVSIGATSAPIDKVVQENHATTHLKKNDLLLKHLAEIKGRVLIFVRTQRRTDRVFHLLQRNGFGVVSLHGGRTQGQRKEALKDFRVGTHPVLVATDIAGRGIDVDDIECVINYDLPSNREDYVHRIGRTARNGKTGKALNYLTPNDHGGKGILSTPQASTKAFQNKPGLPKGGWETKGGRNRPEYSKRRPTEGYGTAVAARPKSADTRPSAKRPFEPRPGFGERPTSRYFQGKSSFGDRTQRPRPFGADRAARKPFGASRPGRPSFGGEDRGDGGRGRPFPRKPFQMRRPGGGKPRAHSH